MMRRILAAFTTAVTACLATAAPADPQIWGNAAEIRVLSDARLGPDGKAAFAELSRAKAYFGALAYNAAADVVIYFHGMSSLDGAIKLALTGCQDASEGREGTCEIYAVSVPRSLPRNALDADGLPRNLLKAWKTDFLDRARPGQHAAFAMSGMGIGGASWDWATAEEAAETAALNCLGFLAKEMAQYPRNLRRRAQSLGLLECPVVATRGP